MNYPNFQNQKYLQTTILEFNRNTLFISNATPIQIKQTNPMQPQTTRLCISFQINAEKRRSPHPVALPFAFRSQNLCRHYRKKTTPGQPKLTSGIQFQ